MINLPLLVLFEPWSQAPTDREREVMACLAVGLSVRDVADQLAISPNTVKRHIEAALRKGQLKNLRELTLRAVFDGLVRLESAPPAGTSESQEDKGK